MKEVSGRIISYVNENMPVEGFTVSKLIISDNFYHVSIFSMVKDTDISVESYTYHNLVLLSGL